MFLDKPEWSDGLRQGDVLGPVPFPLMGKRIVMTYETPLLLGSETVEKPSIIVPAESTLVAVASQCCEFNPGKRRQMLLVRIGNVPRLPSPEQTQALLDSNNVEARIGADLAVEGVDYWVYEPWDAGARRAASFTTITPFSMSQAASFATTKKAELTVEARKLFREKLAYFVGRDPEAETRPD